jgi:regulation of enolase protein 1 (concanavalin A-like superfamily)
MNWYNEPSTWAIQDNKVIIQTEPKTDFWRLTFSGHSVDNGHFYYEQCHGDFLVEVKCSGEYNALYDQAGLMVRLNETTWMKCGIEFIEGVQHVSAVVTRDYSDWSVVALPQNPATLWLRVSRQGITIEVYYSLDGAHYQLLRQSYLSQEDTLDVGLMCASPEGAGFSVTFENFSIRPGK